MSENNPQNNKNTAPTGQNSIDVKNVMQQGWDLLAINQWVIVLGSVVTLVILITVVMTILTLGGVTDAQAIPQNVQMFADIAVTVVLAPLAAGLAMIGVNAARGKSSKVSSIFQFFPQGAWLALTSLLISVLVQLGLLLMIIPGIYLMMASSFALILVADKRMSPVAAVILSIKTVTSQLLQFVLLYSVFALAFVASAFTFGVGFIWSIPFYYNVMGVLYRDLFYVPQQSDVSSPSPEKDSVFDA